MMVPLQQSRKSFHNESCNEPQRRNLLGFPKGSSEPNQFFFDILEKDKDKWHEAWHLIRARLGDGEV